MRDACFSAVFISLLSIPTRGDSPALYNRYHTGRGANRCAACALFPTKLFPAPMTVLDAGSGNCKFISTLRELGYGTFGVEYSTLAVTNFCNRLHGYKIAPSKPTTTVGTVRNVPLRLADYPSNSADLVTSFEVLEHIPESDIIPSLKQIVRISRGQFFGTIPVCLASRDPDPPSPAVLHVTVHNRTWWDAKWAEVGCVPNYGVLDKMYETIRPYRFQRHWVSVLNGVRRCVVPVHEGHVEDKYGTHYAYSCLVQ
mmetsp:Transcript_12697/g.24081  ORF Transcript_12697/g.24081 Transcript_12697/m.24081 type:complete len:255 (+) Transcript_12697:1998-2762(+)